MTQTVVQPLYVYAVSCLLVHLVPLSFAFVPLEFNCSSVFNN